MKSSTGDRESLRKISRRSGTDTISPAAISAGRPKGSGLGLSIVKQIFILHGAKYGVESEIDKGSNFWFELKKDMSVSPAEKNKGRKKAGEKTMRFSAAVKNLRGQADPPPQAAPEPSGAEISPEEPVSSESPAPKSSGPVTSAWQSSSGPDAGAALRTGSVREAERLFTQTADSR